MTAHTHKHPVKNPHAHPDVPKRYQGLPSKLVSALWSESKSRDEKKRAKDNVARTRALEVLHEQELVREHDRERLYDTMIANLSAQRRKDWPFVEQIVTGKITDHVIAGSALDRAATPDELALLEDLSRQYASQKKSVRETTTLHVKDSFDQLIYRNLVKGMALDVMQAIDSLHTLTSAEPQLLLPKPASPKADAKKLTIKMG